MGFQIIFAPQAIERLSAIVEYIARDNPGAAERFGLELVDHTQILADFPELGKRYEKRRNIRRLWCRPYFFYYQVNQESRTIEIMDYWHSAQQEPKFPER